MTVESIGSSNLSAAAAEPVVNPAAAGEPVGPDLRAQVRAAAQRAKNAATVVAQLSSARKAEVLGLAAANLRARAGEVLTANAADVAFGREQGTAESLLDRLRLDEARIEGIANGLHQVAALPDPVGEVVRGYTLPNGLELSQRRVPLGVVGMIYEGRPNVTVDAFGLTFRSGNTVVLRGSSSAYRSNAALVQILRDTLAEAGLPESAVELLPTHSRDSVTHLIQARGLVDIVIPRGGAGLIKAVVENATVPAIETGTGNCHLYIDATADVAEAIALLLNGKTRRPSVCNATETVLVARGLPDAQKEAVVAALRAAGVTVHGELPGMIPLTQQDLEDEYLSLDIAYVEVEDVAEAIAHINRWGTGHTEAISTTDLATARRFAAEVDAAAVMINTSTAFTDGEQFGFGAEIGISTQKLHARGPMGLPELTSTKWVAWGEGQTRP